MRKYFRMLKNYSEVKGKLQPDMPELLLTDKYIPQASYKSIQPEINRKRNQSKKENSFNRLSSNSRNRDKSQGNSISNRRLSTNSRNSGAQGSKKDLKKYLSKIENKTQKMTERSIVVKDNQLMIMLENEDEPQNTSMDIMFKDFKKIFDGKASKKRDVLSTSSQISNHSRFGHNYQTLSCDKLADESMLNNTNSCRYQTQENENSDEKLYHGKPHQTARDYLDARYENLEEIFEEFKQEKYGMIVSGQQTAPNKENVALFDNRSGIPPMHQFMSMKNQKLKENIQSTSNKSETIEERERRLFELIKQRQNCFNDTSNFKNTCSLSSIDKNDVCLGYEIDKKNNFISQNENSIDLDPINTSTFGYGINYNQRRNHFLQSVDQHHDLENDNGMMSTTTSKMNKRYITNQLMESDSSIEDHIINESQNEIVCRVNYPIQNSKLSANSLKQSKSSISKCNKSSNDSENKYIEINENEGIVVLDEELNNIQNFRNELLLRIMTRFDRNSEIFMLKSGYIAFIKNCILIKKVLHLLQIIQKLFIKKQYENEIDFLQNIREIGTILSKIVY